MSVTLYIPKRESNNYLLEISNEAIYKIPCSGCFAKDELYCDGLDTTNHHSFDLMAVDKCKFEEIIISSTTRAIQYPKSISIAKNKFSDNFFYKIA